MPEASTPLEPSLPSLIPASPHSEDSFLIVAGVPSSSQLAVVTSLLIVDVVPSLSTPPALATLAICEEESLMFSLEEVSGIGEVIGKGFPFESTPASPVAPVTYAGDTSPQLPSSASSLLQLLASHIMNLVQGQASASLIPMEATPSPTTTYLALLALSLATDDPLE